jgi:hypothetical protein
MRALPWPDELLLGTAVLLVLLVLLGVLLAQLRRANGRGGEGSAPVGADAVATPPIADSAVDPALDPDFDPAHDPTARPTVADAVREAGLVELPARYRALLHPTGSDDDRAEADAVPGDAPPRPEAGEAPAGEPAPGQVPVGDVPAGGTVNGRVPAGPIPDGEIAIADTRNRLLAVLLDDPDDAVRALADLERCRGQLDQLAASVEQERARLGAALRRLSGAGLGAGQLARLTHLPTDEVRALLTRVEEPGPR